MYYRKQCSYVDLQVAKIKSNFSTKSTKLRFNGIFTQRRFLHVCPETLYELLPALVSFLLKTDLILT